jgi:hypothetical protein
MNHLHHPDVHKAASDWSENQVLHVAAAYSNPFRWRTRRELANDFRRHMEQSPNVVLHMVELAYGDRPFEVTVRDHPGDVQLRTSTELFHKENLLNLGVRHFPSDWHYGAIIDADFHFTRHDWSLEAVHQLQHYDWVQLYSSYTDLSGETLGQGHRVIGSNNTFAFNYVQNGFQIPLGFSAGGWRDASSDALDYAPGFVPAGKARRVGATGGAWAFRRSAFDAVGGLLDRCILGHGDWFMSFGLVGQMAPDMHISGYTADYLGMIQAWQSRAAAITANIGYVDGHAIHHFHGPKVLRGYSKRDLILVREQYEPTRDVKLDWQGVLALTGNKPGLRDAIRAYFLERNEDLPHSGELR